MCSSAGTAARVHLPSRDRDLTATLVDASGVARMLGTSRRQVAQLAVDDSNFPSAAAEAPGARRRWERAEILQWAARQADIPGGWSRPDLSSPGAFTKRTRQVMDVAGRQSEALNHDFIGDVHLLLALLHPDCPGAARKVLESAGVRHEEMRESVIAELGMPERPQLHGRLLDRHTNTLIEQAKLKAIELRDEEVSSEHVLLALAEAGQRSPAGRLLAERDVDPDELAERVIALTDTAGAAARSTGGDTVAVEKIDAAEAARVLSVSRARLAELAASRGFPPSEVGPLGHRRWLRRAIIEWAAADLVPEPPRPPSGQLGAQLGAGGMARRADEIFRLGSDEAERLNHPWVGPDHLLLALLRHDCPGFARAALESFGISLEEVRLAWVETMGDPFEPTDRPLAVPPATHHVLERARLHAIELEDDEVLSEHVLLALTDEWSGSSLGHLIEERGLDATGVRERLVSLSDGLFPAPKPSPPRTWPEPSPKRIPRPPEPELARSPLGHDPRRRRPWGPGVFSTPEGKSFKQGIALRQYRIDRDGYPVLTTDGKTIHSLIDDDGRYVLDEEGNHIDAVIEPPPGALVRAYPKD